MTDSPMSTVPPCNDSFDGRLLQDWCRDCRHALAVHRWDRVCSVCDAVAEIREYLRQS